MTNPIEGMQGDNGPIESEYEPMRPDDPHQGEGGEVVVEVDQDTDAALTEGYEAAISATARRIKDLAESGITPVPEGGVITDQFMVHDDDDDPRRARNAPATPDPREVMFIGVQEHVRSMVALNTLDAALRWAGGYANRKVFPVRSITVGPPLVGVVIPERRVLMSEEEAMEMNREERIDD